VPAAAAAAAAGLPGGQLSQLLHSPQSHTFRPCPCLLLLLLLLLCQGYLVGNGCTDVHFDGNAQVPFAQGKSLISASLFSSTQEACDGKFYDAPEGSRCDAQGLGQWCAVGSCETQGTCL
jgi:hypothetical protein